MLLDIDDISILYPEDATSAAIEFKTGLAEKCNITNLGSA
jgi:hypothetical protein